MISRRDFAIGGACAGGSALAYIAKPRRLVSLMPRNHKLTDVLPRSFGRWTSQDISDLVAPETQNSLAARLYGETVCRLYQRDDGVQLVMLMAHGDVQSNELQLHRPETCYPAFGYSISESKSVDIRVGDHEFVPGRQLLARSSSRNESIIYWTRLGEYFPTSVAEQRFQRLTTAVHRYVPDGLLARFSTASQDNDAAVDILRLFVTELISNVGARFRSVIIGTERARLLNSY